MNGIKRKKGGVYMKQYIKNILIVFICFIFNIIFLINISFAETSLDADGFAIWSWSPYEIYNVDEVLEVAKENNIKKIFQYFDFKNTNNSDINNFVKKLKENNIYIYALTGESSWAHAENHKEFEYWTNDIITYNNEYPNERIIGISLDIEIHTEEDFSIQEKKNQLLNEYQNLTWFIKNKAYDNNLIVNHVIPFWYEYEKGHSDHGVYDLAEWAFLMGDEVSIMAYEHEDLEAIVEKEMEYANKYGKQVYLGFETQMIGIDGIEDSNTYYRRGIDRMYYDFGYIKKKYSSVNIMSTIHHYNSFKDLISLQSDLLWVSNNPVDIAEESRSPLDLYFARKIVNALPDSPEKNSLQSRLNSIVPNISLTPQLATSNIDIYIKSENMLSLSLDTNSVTFEDFSGVEDMEKLNAISLTINSSLPYRINAYLATEIQNGDKSKIMDKEILNIRANGNTDYNTFVDTTTPVVLLDDHQSGNNINHDIDLMLKGNLSHEKDVYKTTIKFEVVQK